jgi:hypothetical protein
MTAPRPHWRDRGTHTECRRHHRVFARGFTCGACAAEETGARPAVATRAPRAVLAAEGTLRLTASELAALQREREWRSRLERSGYRVEAEPWAHVPAPVERSKR